MTDLRLEFEDLGSCVEVIQLALNNTRETSYLRSRICVAIPSQAEKATVR